jgi:hypothetical protein
VVAVCNRYHSCQDATVLKQETWFMFKGAYESLSLKKRKEGRGGRKKNTSHHPKALRSLIHFDFFILESGSNFFVI